MSIPLWLVFEGYNLLIKNWYYINLPENLLVRYFGYAWAFATISPGIFQTAELVAILRGCATVRPARGWLPTCDCRLSDLRLMVTRSSARPCSVCRSSGRRPIWRRPFSSASCFCSIPINARAGDESLLARPARPASYERLINLLIAGFICGGLWEFWNFWARAKWIYTVPILGDIKIFEMPVLGYFGFPPFAARMLRDVCLRPAAVLAAPRPADRSLARTQAGDSSGLWTLDLDFRFLDLPTAD